MLLPSPLIPARLLRRYKRFLADVILPDGSAAVAHCPNPGSMLGLAAPGTVCWLSDHRGSSRKLPFGWELTELTDPLHAERPGALVGINTGLANAIVAEALSQRRMTAFADYDDIRREVPVGTTSRLDFQLGRNSAGSAPVCYLEVKSVTLSRQPGLAEFPDSRTARGAKHLLELAALAAAGHRAVLLFLVQRDDCRRVRCAGDIDPSYDALLREVAGRVEIRAYGCDIGRVDGQPAAITLAEELLVEGI
jgi:sugar fermentation stimulation protein A